MNKRSISPLIATILLIVVSVILITVILTWGSDFAKNNTEKANTFLESSKHTPKSGVFWLDSLIGDKVILKNNLSSSIEIKGYKILTNDFNSDYFWLNSYRPLENNVIFTASSINPISLVCVPESKFFLELIDINDQPYSLEINPRGNNFYTRCNTFNVPLWEFETISGSYTINTFTKEQGELVTNGGFDDSSWWNINHPQGWSISDGKLRFANSSSGLYTVTPEILEIGKTYKLSFNLELVNGTCYTYIGFPGGIKSYSISGRKTFIYTVKSTDSLKLSFSAKGGSIFNIDNVSIVEVDPLPTITDGTKYLEALSTSTTSIQSSQAYGSWEFDVKVNYGNRSYYHFISTDPSIYLSEGYFVVLNYYGDGQLGLAKSSNAGVLFGHLYRTSIGYLSNNFIYRIKVIRTKGNIFSLYIKGGLFGDEYSLVSVVGEQGSNPRFDNTYTKSNYFILSLSDGDFLANLKITPEIDQ